MAEEVQVLVKFVTKLPKELKVPETPVAVPATLKRYGLSQIINHLLALDPARPFDFLINGQLLRKTLHQHLLDNALSAETTLEVEYVPAVVPPKHKQSAPHDDWVSCVDASWGDVVASGSYDGNIRMWNGELECSSVFHAHGEGGVTSLSCLPSSQGEGLLMSGGKDREVKLWRVGGSEQPCTLLASFSGHTDAVEGLALSPDGQQAATCGWDGALLVWRTGASVAEEADASISEGGGKAAGGNKKRKTGAGAEGGASASGAAAPHVEAPLSQLQGHLHCVGCVTWPSSSTLYSGGWDHSVRRWDVATGVNTETYNGSKAVHSAAACHKSPDVVAFGGADRVLRVWDSRSRKGEALAVQAFPSHTAWISSVKWSPQSEHHVATASHDASVKLWDIRSSIPLATLSAHTDKALCVAWLPAKSAVAQGGTALLSGGADCTLRLYTVDQ